MGLVIQKFGGSSVADADRIQAVAGRAVDARRAGDGVVVVVSAMGDMTDRLIAMAHQISPAPNPRELDLLLSAGERVAMSLLGLAVNDLGYPAASYTGSQAGVITDTAHGRARIVDVRPFRIVEALALGRIVIVGGFQGVSTDHDVTTLGRGGSDTTAVALAAALGADRCEIFTDVPGVLTADPRVVPAARLLHAVSYDEMLEMAASGAKVLALRAVEYARGSGVRIHVRSSFDDGPGTWVVEEDERMERAVISGVTCDRGEAIATLEGVPADPAVEAAIFAALAEARVGVDMVVRGLARDGRADMSFTVSTEGLAAEPGLIRRIAAEAGAAGSSVQDRVAKVSLVGAGMKSHFGVVAEMLRALSDEGIPVLMISASSIRVSCMVAGEAADAAVRAVHDRLGVAGQSAVRGSHAGVEAP